MLREEVVREWKGCKEIILAGKQRQLSPKLAEMFNMATGELFSKTSDFCFSNPSPITDLNIPKLWSLLKKGREKEHEIKVAFSKLSNIEYDYETVSWSADTTYLIYNNVVDILSKFIKVLEDKCNSVGPTIIEVD